jgi:hypothetical protein
LIIMVYSIKLAKFKKKEALYSIIVERMRKLILWKNVISRDGISYAIITNNEIAIR